MTPTAKVLTRALARLMKYGWIKHASGNTKTGFCSLGAIHAGRPMPSVFVDAREALRAVPPTLLSVSLSSWNDAPERRKRQVIARFKQAIKRAG